MTTQSGRVEVIAERAVTKFTSKGYEYHDNGDRAGCAIGFTTKGAAREHAKANGWPTSDVQRFTFHPWGNIVFCVCQQMISTTRFLLEDGRIYIVQKD